MLKDFSVAAAAADYQSRTVSVDTQVMLRLRGVISREKEDDLERRFKLLNHELRNCLSIEGQN